jgi:hypothetical protein
MKRVLVAGLIAVSGITSAFAWGPHEQGILTGIAGLWTYQQLSRPQVVVAPQPQVIYQQTQTLPAPVYQPEVRVLPQYSPAYPGPNGCYPVYTQQGQFAGQMCR